MKINAFPLLLLFFLAIGCAHSPAPTAYPNQSPAQTTIEQAPTPAAQSETTAPQSIGAAVPLAQKQQSAEIVSASNVGNASSAAAELEGDYQEPEELRKPGDYQSTDNSEKNGQGENGTRLTIADPLEPFNRAMFQFNDKLYFWVLKPVARAYKKVVHEDVRVVVKNFFSNAAFPARFVNCLLQANLTGAASEVGRFALNTLVGFGGMFDPASDKEINLAKHGEDFGQTLGLYGIGHGFYIHWPIFGPSSPRDTIGMAGDGFLNPFSYLDQWYESAGVGAYERINDVSFSIGDYEALKQAALDPYVAVRDAYVQYRFNKVKRRDGFYAPARGEKPER
ncbi:MAG: VacJ family lipoprotein [Syntrophobacterales bacterium]|nr:VacJ family lipoprotein [Syntrophobacterales bacterium]